MASVKSVLRARAQARKEAAELKLNRLKDQSLDRDQLLAAMAADRLSEVDPEAAAMRQARADLELLERPVSTEDEEAEGKSGPQLELFGEVYPFAANRLIVSADGKTVIENNLATLVYKRAERDRAAENVRRAEVHLRRKTWEAEHYADWLQSEAVLGRDVLDLSWGACVRETGILRQA